jgi:catechol 2,3-dioxygenase-like lactoylglutathione lyase family enzyme
MSIQLNHTIVASHDKGKAAGFLSEILGLPPPVAFGPFLAVQADNGVTLDFMDASGEIPPAHYAFLVSEAELDLVLARVRERGLRFWADPHHEEPNTINTRDGGRGFYFEDPDGHNLEVLTRPYGSAH